MTAGTAVAHLVTVHARHRGIALRRHQTDRGCDIALQRQQYEGNYEDAEAAHTVAEPTTELGSSAIARLAGPPPRPGADQCEP